MKNETNAVASCPECRLALTELAQSNGKPTSCQRDECQETSWRTLFGLVAWLRSKASLP